MSDELSHETESFIQQQIALGVFSNRADAIEAGISLLRNRQELQDRLRKSRRQLDEGQFTEFDDDGLRQLFEELKEQSRQRAAAN
jgi:Arc/MetJ-type ribon-helix-helix transcriptional regulator